MHIQLSDLLRRIPDHARVLDLGGWHRVLPRADVVVDLNDYESRTIVHPDVPERFTRKDWIVADFGTPTFWSTIGDKEFDFITITGTLEEVRDPIYVCSQMIRCAKAGYIEVPAKFLECAKLRPENTFSGFAHHRWIIDPMPDLTGLIFKQKMAWAHHRDYLGDDRRKELQNLRNYTRGYFWTGSFCYVEQFSKGMGMETEDLLYFYRNYTPPPSPFLDLVPNSKCKADGTCLFPNAYELPHQSEQLALIASSKRLVELAQQRDAIPATDGPSRERVWTLMHNLRIDIEYRRRRLGMPTNETILGMARAPFPDRDDR